MNWNAELDCEVLVRFGPFDESDEANHDPDSLAGEEDESGFDEMADSKEWATFDDDGFDDAGGEDDDDAEADAEAEDEE